MKILHLIYSQQVAGAEKYLLDILPGLKQKGIDCSLVCVIPVNDSHKFTEFCRELNSKGVPTEIFNGSTSSLLSVARRINDHLKKNEIKYIHAHLFKADMLAVLIKKLFNKRMVILSTKHGYDEAYFNKHPLNPGKIDHNIYYFISKFVNANIDAQVTTSKAMSDLYYNLKLTTTRIPYIHHGIDLAIPAETGDCRLADPQLIIVGRIEKIKGHIYLFEAMPEVIKKFPGVKLLILGNGKEKQQLEDKAAALGITDNIKFMGFQPNPAGYITSSDIIIQPSLYESFGLIYIEAFALKVPVIAFDVQAGNEIISNNETGILVPVFNTAALAEKIIFLLENPLERERIFGNAYKRYCEYFNTARMITETIAWYNSLVFP